MLRKRLAVERQTLARRETTTTASEKLRQASTPPWRPLVVFMLVSAGATTLIAALTASQGWTVRSPAWAVLAPLAMWAPALGRFLSRRTVDRNFASTLPLSRWGETGARVIALPLAVPLVVYGIAYLVAWTMGIANWSPGGGRWTSGGQIGLNLIVNLTLLAAFGTATALGEEIGWRGYLQPRLDAAGVRFSVIIVCICQIVYHAPLNVGAGYASAGGPVGDMARFAAADLVLTFRLGGRVLPSPKPMASRVLSQLPQHGVAVVVPTVLRRWRERAVAGRGRVPASRRLRGCRIGVLGMDATAGAVLAGTHRNAP